MSKNILLTSFTTWLPDQKSNSSDDLLQEISHLHPQYSFLRQLPVNIELASNLVTTKIAELQPDSIICCGMAQKRSQLTVEAKASSENEWLNTRVNLHQLIAGIDRISISYDAGRFVCEGLYYSILKYLHNSQVSSNCIFVHIPLLSQNNLAEVKSSFLTVVQRLTLV